MTESPTQARLFDPAPPPPVRQSLTKSFILATEGDLHVVFRWGVPLYHCRLDDSVGRYWVMVELVRHHGLKVRPVSIAFGVHRKTLHEMLGRFDEEGFKGLFPRDRRPTPSKIKEAVASRLLALKRQGVSNREAARRLGVSEGGVRGALSRLGWTDPSEVVQNPLPFSGDAPVGHEEDVVESAATPEHPIPDEDAVADGCEGSCVNDEVVAETSGSTALAVVPNLLPSVDADPLNRSGDRLMAHLGLLDDAPPMFASGVVPRGGVLLAVPFLIKSGIFDIARRVFGSIGPAFYGLRTSVLVFLVMALARIKRAENLKEVSPADLGRIVGLDRVPEVKTLRRKLHELAAKGDTLEFMRLLAKERAEEHADDLAYLYVDGHVRVYSGQEDLSKAYVMQRRLAMPGTTDYWVNDKAGQPLLVITAEANEGLSKMLPAVLDEVRNAVGDRRLTVVFDRGGWKQKLFLSLIKDQNWDILTYRKGKTRNVPRKSFQEHTASIDGREVKYVLSEKHIRLLKGKLKLRQITVLAKHDHQTHIVTSREDLGAAEAAYWMFNRWRQENYFKYMEEEFALDALATYEVEPADPKRMVPNPAWKEIDKELRAARTSLAKLEQEYGVAALENEETSRPTMRGFKIATGRTIGKSLRTAQEKVSALLERRERLPKRVPVSETKEDGENPVRLRTATKRLTDTFKMVAYQAESSLVGLLQPHYHRSDDEGRKLIAGALRGAAELDVRPGELRVTLAPLSSAHRTQAIRQICKELNEMGTRFPGTDLVLRFGVAEPKVWP